jgi:hypothetical protein
MIGKDADKVWKDMLDAIKEVTILYLRCIEAIRHLIWPIIQTKLISFVEVLNFYLCHLDSPLPPAGKKWVRFIL